MAEKQIVAISFADLHLHKFKDQATSPAYRERLVWSMKALKRICDRAEELNVPVLFNGDLFHDPAELESEVSSLAQMFFSRHKGIFFAISGNHDLSQKNTLVNTSPTHLNSFTQYANFIKLDNTSVQTKSLYLTGIPYYNAEEDLIKRIKEEKENIKALPRKGLKILMLHNDMPGAVNPMGESVKGCKIPKDLDKFFKPWDLVLCGHIHKPQKLSGKVYMLGSPIQQNFGDEDCDMGYWEIYSNGKMKFVHLEEFPKFVRIAQGLYDEAIDQLASEGRLYDYVKPIPEEGDEKGEDTSDYGVTKSRTELARAYCRDRGIKDKKKIRKLIECLNNE